MHKPKDVEVADRDWSDSVATASAIEASTEADVIVVGGGVAGWTAACLASEYGANVVVVERATGGPGGGNTLLSAGVFHAAYHSPDERPEVLREAILAKVDGCAREDVVAAWAANVSRARDYLASHGGSFFQPFEGDDHFANVLEPFRIFAAPTTRDLVRTEAWRGMGPHVLLSRMHDEVLGRGGRFFGGTRARALVRRGDEIGGVEVELSDGSRGVVSGRAVVLADGGFQANAELVAQHIVARYRLRGSANDQGDALMMATDVGAQTANMDSFYGHALHRDALHNEALWPDPSPEHLIDHGVVVDGLGRRFVDEWRGSHPWAAFSDKVSGAIARCETPGTCWLVVDETLWETIGREAVGAPMNPTIEEEGAVLVRAQTIDELGGQTGLPVDALRASIESFNRYCNEGIVPDPPRSGPTRALSAPFVAVPLIAGITFTMGGILVDGNGRALGVGDVPIPGLYAAGGSMAGLSGGPRNGYAGGWSEAATFGLLAGEHAATWSLGRPGSPGAGAYG